MEKALHELVHRKHLTVDGKGNVIATGLRGQPVLGTKDDGAAAIAEKLKRISRARPARS